MNFSRILKNHSDAFCDFIREKGNTETSATHGRLAREIDRVDSESIKKFGDMSWSENIHGNSSKCAAWVKR